MMYGLYALHILFVRDQHNSCVSFSQHLGGRGKYFEIGDYVKVLSGDHAGDAGHVEKVGATECVA